MTRLDALFHELQARREGAFVPFLVAGDPDLERSLALARALVEAGADMLEIGLPFSDPPADGPVIQAANLRALSTGATPDGVFELIEALQPLGVPVGMLTYANLPFRYGLDRFYRRAAQVGLDAVLVADLPLEEAEPFVAPARAHGVAPVFVASELSTEERLRRVGELGQGYLYAVARVGITGERSDLDGGLPGALARMRAAGLPILAGFGLSRPEHVRQVLAWGADGAICGSAIVRRIAAHLDDFDAMVAAVADLARDMKDATRPGGSPC